MSRLNPPNSATLTQAQQEVHDAITSGPRGAVVGPLGIWLWRPELAQRAQTLGQYWHHKPIALQAGLDKDIVEAIRKGDAPSFTNADEQCVYDLATSLYNTRSVPDATYQAAMKVLGQDAVIDLVGVLGYYAFISMTINVFEVDADGKNELT